MFKKVLKVLGLLMFVVFFIVTLAFTSHEYKDIKCKNIQVEFRDNDVIKISKDEVIRMVKSADKNIIGKKLDDINSEIIEQQVQKNRAILKAEVYKVIARDTTSYKGILSVKIKHRQPVLRVISSSGNYYMDKFGEKIPVSINYAADVMVATGNFSEQFAREQLLPFVLYVEDNDFWNAQLEQIYVENNGDVLLTPLIGDQIIELGKPENYEEKLRNMKAFYEQVLAKNNWDKYKRISLKYKDQVIAKKR